MCGRACAAAAQHAGTHPSHSPAPCPSRPALPAGAPPYCAITKSCARSTQAFGARCCVSQQCWDPEGRPGYCNTTSHTCTCPPGHQHCKGTCAKTAGATFMQACCRSGQCAAGYVCDPIDRMCICAPGADTRNWGAAAAGAVALPDGPLHLHSPSPCSGRSDRASRLIRLRCPCRPPPPMFCEQAPSGAASRSAASRTTPKATAPGAVAPSTATSP